MSALSMLRRASAQLLRHKQAKGGGSSGWPGGSFWSEGTQTGHNGFLYGELPLKPGESRNIQWWESAWYLGYAAFFGGIYLIYHAKPLEALDIKYWARPQAQLELEVEQRMLDKLQARPDLQARLQAVARQLNLVDDEVVDLVMMRKEYKVLMGLHDGRVPADLKDVYEELAA